MCKGWAYTTDVRACQRADYSKSRAAVMRRERACIHAAPEF
jgi:hypothetical protein